MMLKGGNVILNAGNELESVDGLRTWHGGRDRLGKGRSSHSQSERCHLQMILRVSGSVGLGPLAHAC